MRFENTASVSDTLEESVHLNRKSPLNRTVLYIPIDRPIKTEIPNFPNSLLTVQDWSNLATTLCANIHKKAKRQTLFLYMHTVFHKRRLQKSSDILEHNQKVPKDNGTEKSSITAIQGEKIQLKWGTYNRAIFIKIRKKGLYRREMPKEERSLFLQKRKFFYKRGILKREITPMGKQYQSID